MRISLHGLSLVAGNKGNTAGRTFHAMDPAAGSPLQPDFHEALPAEIGQAMDAAAKLLEPKVQPVRVAVALLRTKSDLREWLGRQDQVLSKALEHGPVQVS